MNIDHAMTISAFLSIIVAGVALGQRVSPWDGPLAPIDNGRMIVAASCARGEKLDWSTALRERAHGLEPGERVWMITRAGATEVRLGQPACYAGECRGDYAALELPTRESDSVVAIVPLRFLGRNDRVQPLPLTGTREGSCPQPPTLEWKADVCRTFDLGTGERRLQVQIERRPMQDGWDVIRTHARLITRSTAGRWQVVSEATSSSNPEAFMFRGTSESVLWRQTVGIGGPAEITLFLSRIEPDGSLTFGRRYTAGGQPCD